MEPCAGRETDKGLHLETKQPSVFEKETEYSAVRGIGEVYPYGVSSVLQEDGFFIFTGGIPREKVHRTVP